MNFYDEILCYGPLFETDKKIKPSEENVEKYTNKKFLLEEFDQMTKDIGDICLQDHVVLQYKQPNKEIHLKPENLVHISTLTKSVDKVLVGKFFLGRCITKPIQLAAIAFLMEDPNGEQAVRVGIYNSGLSLASFNIGTIVTIISPYFRSLKDGSLALRTYSANHIIILSNKEAMLRFPGVKWHVKRVDSEIPTDEALQYRKDGNAHFTNRCYDSAIACYTKGLALLPNDEGLLCNRSLCYLRSSEYNEALKDAVIILRNNPTHVKAIHRVGSAYLGLKKYDEAKNFLQTKLQLNIEKEDIRNLLEKVEESITQRDVSQYDMVKLYASMGENIEHEIKDYVGPVRIAHVGEKGRGLVATKDLEPGELLICCKGFAVYYRDFDSSWKVRAAIFVPLVKLHQMIAKKITETPESGREFYRLMTGEYMEPSYITSGNYRDVCMTRIEFVVSYNIIEDHTPGKQSAFGIWILPSYINHDCIDPNCTVNIFGNVCQVRSIKKVKKGQELLRSYVEPGFGPKYRAYLLEAMRTFACECRLCLAEKPSPAECLNRDTVVHEFVKEGFNDANDLNHYIRGLVKINPYFEYNNYYLTMPYLLAGDLSFLTNNYQRAILYYSEFLDYANKSGGDLVRHLHKATTNLFIISLKTESYLNAFRYRMQLLSQVKLYLGSCDDALMELMNPGITNLFRSLDDQPQIKNLIFE